jgi:DNA polymerase (family 10)
VTTAGSFRRGRDTVGDLDVLVCSRSNVELGRLLTKFDQTEELLAGGATSARARLRGGLQLDVRRVAPESCGAALVYFTGSKAHNVRIRTQARSLGLRINEYGVFRGRKRIAGETEESVYAALGLPWIPPELREDEGEIEAARQHRLPVLLERADLRGDLHVHTLASDGRASVAQMAKAAQKAGLKYLAIADHGRHLGIVHGLDAQDLARQIEQIERYNSSGPAVTLLKAAEVDILDDGSLCLPDAILGRLDLVIAAVHTGLGKTARQQTSRLLRALDNRYVSILAHPTGRLMPDRPPIQADWATIFRRAAQRPCYLEINAQPARLDLDDTLARAAAKSGALLSVASDAHDVRELALLGGGVMQARRAWITRERVINTRGLEELRPLLRATMR